MVIYGVSADVSIGRLFLAGVVPGVLMGLSLMVMVAVIAPTAGLAAARVRRSSRGLARVPRRVWALLTPVILLGGMFSGLFTPTEAAAVACLYALFLGFVVYRTLPLRDAAGNCWSHRGNDRHRMRAGHGRRRRSAGACRSRAFRRRWRRRSSPRSTARSLSCWSATVLLLLSAASWRRWRRC